MNSLEANNLLSEVDLTISNINRLGVIDPLERSYLSKYLVVYVCGIYEESFELILKEKFSRIRLKYITNHLSDELSQYFRNPDFNKICQWLERYSQNWSKKIKQLPQINKDAITSIVNLKNALAHTGSVSITWDEAVKYFEDSRIVIEELDRIIL